MGDRLSGETGGEDARGVREKLLRPDGENIGEQRDVEPQRKMNRDA